MLVAWERRRRPTTSPLLARSKKGNKRLDGNTDSHVQLAKETKSSSSSGIAVSRSRRGRGRQTAVGSELRVSVRVGVSENVCGCWCLCGCVVVGVGVLCGRVGAFVCVRGCVFFRNLSFFGNFPDFSF